VRNWGHGFSSALHRPPVQRCPSLLPCVRWGTARWC